MCLKRHLNDSSRHPLSSILHNNIKFSSFFISTFKENPMDKSFDKVSIYRMHIFNAVIKCKSAKAASRELSIPYTTLMLEIRRLEKTLGTLLLVKDKKKAVLTEEGIKFAKFSQEILDIFNEQNFTDLSID